MKILLKPILDRNALLKQANAKRKQFDGALDEMARGAQKDFNKATANWKHKPSFEIVKTKNTAAIKISGLNAAIFGFVDRGTRPHIIRPKRAQSRKGRKGTLVFRTGYQAKTRPNNTQFVGSGVASGPWRSAKQVRHPGSKARNITRIIAKRWQEEGRKILRKRLGVKVLAR